MNESQRQKAEKFSQVFIETGNASEAYRQAFPKNTMTGRNLHLEAYRYSKRPHVSLMIEGLREEHRERHNMTVDDLIKELEEARQAGLEFESASAMVAATMGKAKLLGLDKQLIDVTTNGGSINNPTVIELVAHNVESSD